MGGGCSTRPGETQETEQNVEKLQRNQIRKQSALSNKRVISSTYHLYSYKNLSSLALNLIMFTSIGNLTNEYNVIEGEKKDMQYTGTFKVHGVAVGYYKGYKLDAHNQDKFFVLIDGNVEMYCMIDGHGPYGNVIAQIVQDNIFKGLMDVVFTPEFDSDYEKILSSLFENVHNAVISKQDYKYKNEYDPYLSGAAVTFVLKKENTIYCANIGNVMALLFFAERTFSYKFETTELTFNDSSFKAEFALMSQHQNILKLLNDNGGVSNNINNLKTLNSRLYATQRTTVTSDYPDVRDQPNPSANLHKNFDMNEELRRIYESGGEIRKLAGEEKSRIFVKGKYFPGLINTRSIGDQIGAQIGISCTPHICKFTLHDKTNYYLFMCTDGITNVLKNDVIINLIENNDVLPLESINSIIQTAKQEYRKNSYCPDMTIILKNLNNKIKK